MTVLAVLALSAMLATLVVTASTPSPVSASSTGGLAGSCVHSPLKADVQRDVPICISGILQTLTGFEVNQTRVCERMQSCP
jgi:hypothetical protein